MILCYYCGEDADSVDHVVPQSLIADLGDDGEALDRVTSAGRILLVDACRDCNSRLSNIFDRTLIDRRLRLRKLLRRRYRKLLEMPEWTDSELGKLGPWLQGYVLSGISRRAWVLRRLNYNGPATLNGSVIS